MLGDLGLTFAAGNVDDLQRQLEAALDELPALREQAGQAASSIAAIYDWDVVADQTIALYETVLEARRGAGRRDRATV